MPSSVIKDFSYDAAHARLTVTFTTGRVYEYFAVPADIAAAFRNAGSKGAYFNTHIRDTYPCKERPQPRLATSSDSLRDALKRSAGPKPSDEDDGKN